MTIYVPGGFILVFISLYFFREYHRVKEAKQEERRENLHAVRQAYLHNLIKAKNQKANDPEKTDEDTEQR